MIPGFERFIKKLIKLMLGLLVMSNLIPACKQSQESDQAKIPTQEELCLAQGEGRIWTGTKCVIPAKNSPTKESCEKLSGATWNQSDYKCDRPQKNSDCDKIGEGLVWNGEQCVGADQPKNFYLYCTDSESSDQIKHTVAIISKEFITKEKTPNCQEVFDQLNKKYTLTIHNERIEALEPLQGLINIHTLDLWNNNISDLNPLKSLTNLTILKVGHNNISDISALSELKKLKNLFLFENKIEDISPVAELPELNYLDVSFNKISDVSSLSKDKFTQGLFMDGNPVSQ